MFRQYTTGNKLFHAVLVTLLLAACGGSQPLVKDSLDPQTGVTITRSTKPLILYRDRSAVAAHARDYVYVGPVETNNMGRRRYFLWLGVWSTSESSSRASELDEFESIVIYADGEPLGLNVAGWNPAAIGVSGTVYVKPVASATDAFYAVTIDQIRVIAEATDVELRTGRAATGHFQPWEGSPSAAAGLRAFVQEVDF
jgi:hypothetical protein